VLRFNCGVVGAVPMCRGAGTSLYATRTTTDQSAVAIIRIMEVRPSAVSMSPTIDESFAMNLFASDVGKPMRRAERSLPVSGSSASKA